jgi:hypothetical protein
MGGARGSSSGVLCKTAHADTGRLFVGGWTSGHALLKPRSGLYGWNQLRKGIPVSLTAQRVAFCFLAYHLSQEELAIFRRWILRENDRGLWVPGVSTLNALWHWANTDGSSTHTESARYYHDFDSDGSIKCDDDLEPINECSGQAISAYQLDNHHKLNILNTTTSSNDLNTTISSIPPQLRSHHNFNPTTTSIPPQLQYHHIFNPATTSIPPQTQFHHNFNPTTTTSPNTNTS